MIELVNGKLQFVVFLRSLESHAMCYYLTDECVEISFVVENSASSCICSTSVAN